jgi:hypothetical protein
MLFGFSPNAAFHRCMGPIGIFFGGITSVERASSMATTATWETACSGRELDQQAGGWEGESEEIEVGF